MAVAFQVFRVALCFFRETDTRTRKGKGEGEGARRDSNLSFLFRSIFESFMNPVSSVLVLIDVLDVISDDGSEAFQSLCLQ